MALSAGTRLGPYEILEPLGAGGMGEVYRARDTRLDRTVAIKVLPGDLAADPQLKARFEREARAISALAHPNICTLHDVGEQDGKTFLVMEHLAGETLAERLKKGSLPLQKALEIGAQIADALSAAHKQGVVHRDLKPANVMLTKTGARLLDFGLAGVTGHGEQLAAESLTSAPTEPRPLTGQGTIMGTLPYMAPEQIQGKPADARTDLWALGTVVYEMLSGDRPFQAENPTSLIGAILEREPAPLKERQPLTPPSLERLVRRCLAKDPDDRWDTAHDVADELRWIAELSSQPIAPSSGPGSARRRWPVISLAATLALVAIAAAYWLGASPHSDGARAPAPPAPVTRAVIELPADAPLALGGAIGFDSVVIALSPDGRQLVYVGDSGQGRKLYVRRMDDFEVTPIPGTEGAVHPFFSPDGRWVGFLTTDKVKKVSLRGGAPLTLCDARTPIRATWTRDDLVYFAESEGTVLSRVPASGGEPVNVPRETGEVGIWKIGQVLPDGTAALATRSRFSGGSDHKGVLLLSLGTRDTALLLSSGYDARHVPSGHLLFARSGNLLAAPLDLERPQATGEPALVISDVTMDSFFAQAQVATSASGSLAYVPGGDSAIGRLAWVDRKGNTDFLEVPERLYGRVDLAPLGKRVAVQVADINDYIWIYDTDRGEGRKLTTEGAAGFPLWTPDGEGIAFTAFRSGAVATLSRSVDAPTHPVEWPDAGTPQSWSPDGRVLAGFGRVNQQGGLGVKFVRVDGRPVPEWLTPQGTSAWGHQFSPDGHWVAYASDETGRSEVWVRSYPDGATVRQISLEGGVEPVWCEDCDELFYRKGNQWMSTAITLQPELSWETARLVFETEFTDTPGRSYDVSPDGQRLLVVKSTREPTRTKIHVVHNWFEELKRLVPAD